jgi:hypothetical protein
MDFVFGTDPAVCQQLEKWQAQERCVHVPMKPSGAIELKIEETFCERANKGISDEESRRRYVIAAVVIIDGRKLILDCEAHNVLHKRTGG